VPAEGIEPTSKAREDSILLLTEFRFLTSRCGEASPQSRHRESEESISHRTECRQCRVLPLTIISYAPA